VKIISTPGHTPGHQSLLVRLPRAGNVVLSGDVAHFEENFVNRRVPSFNFNIEQTRQSMDKIDAILKAEHAQLWINHDAKQSATIPHAPLFVQIRRSFGKHIRSGGTQKHRSIRQRKQCSPALRARGALLQRIELRRAHSFCEFDTRQLPRDLRIRFALVFREDALHILDCGGRRGLVL